MPCTLCKSSSVGGSRCAFEEGSAFLHNRDCGTLLALWGALEKAHGATHPLVKMVNTRPPGEMAPMVVAYLVDVSGVKAWSSWEASAEFFWIGRRLGWRDGAQMLDHNFSALLWGMEWASIPSEAECRTVIGYLERTKPGEGSEGSEGSEEIPEGGAGG